MKSEILFSTGEFARLHGINKRTLQYYDSIGLFSPAVKKENNYRYYSSFQSPAFEMLLLFRQLGLLIDDIQNRMQHMNEMEMAEFFLKKQKDIEQEIKQLRSVRNNLGEKAAMLLETASDLSALEIVQLPAKTLLLSPYDNDKNDEENFLNLMKETKGTPSEKIYRETFGTMISVEKLKSGNMDSYDYLFVEGNACGSRQADEQAPQLDSSLHGKRHHRQPAGDYLRAYSKGPWHKLKRTYARMIEFAGANGLTLAGYAYETGLNDFCAQTMEDYITRILIPISSR